MMGLSDGERISTIRSAVLIQYTRTDRQTELAWHIRVYIYGIYIYAVARKIDILFALSPILMLNQMLLRLLSYREAAFSFTALLHVVLCRPNIHDHLSTIFRPLGSAAP